MECSSAISDEVWERVARVAVPCESKLMVPRTVRYST